MKLGVVRKQEGEHQGVRRQWKVAGRISGWRFSAASF